MSTPPPRMPLSTKLWYGVGYLPDSIMNNLFYALVFVVYQIELGIAGTIIGSAMMASRLVEAFIDPFFGNLSDQTRTRWGRRRPYMVAGALLGGALTIALWMPPRNPAEVAKLQTNAIANDLSSIAQSLKDLTPEMIAKLAPEPAAALEEGIRVLHEKHVKNGVGEQASFEYAKSLAHDGVSGITNGVDPEGVAGELSEITNAWSVTLDRVAGMPTGAHTWVDRFMGKDEPKEWAMKWKALAEFKDSQKASAAKGLFVHTIGEIPSSGDPDEWITMSRVTMAERVKKKIHALGTASKQEAWVMAAHALLALEGDSMSKSIHANDDLANEMGKIYAEMPGNSAPLNNTCAGLAVRNVLGGDLTKPITTSQWTALSDASAGQKIESACSSLKAYNQVATIYLAVISILFYVAYAIYSVPFMALGLGMSSNDSDRTSLFGWRVAANNLVCCTIVPAAALLVYNKMLGDTPMTSIANLGIIAGLLVVFFGILAAMNIREKDSASEITKTSHVGLLDGFRCVTKSRPFLMTTGIVSFTIIGMCAAGNLTMYLNLTNVFPGGTNVEKELAAHMAWISGTVAAVLGLVFAPMVSTISARMGRKNMLMTAIFGIMVAFLLSPILFNKTYPYLQLVFATMTNLCVTSVWVLTLPMLADACDYDEIQNGVRREGIFTAMYNWGIKVAVAMIGVMSGLVIDNSGFVATLAEQSASTKAILTWSFALGPIPFFAACAVMTWYFPLSAEKIQAMRAQRATETETVLAKTVS